MYYEEKVIKGILYFRTSPNGPWQEMSKERLTELLEAERRRTAELLSH